MKKSIFILLFAFLMSICINVRAKSTCSDERMLELSSLANNVNVSYQQYDVKSEPYYNDAFAEDNYQEVTHYFYVTIYNLDKSLNAYIVREDTKQAIIVDETSKDSDGVIYVKAGEATMVKPFTITIRSNDSNCKNEPLKTVTVTTPMFNKYSYTDTCEQNPDFALCQEYTLVDYSDVTEKSFLSSLEEYKVQKAEEEKRANSFFYRIWSFIVNHRWYFIIPIIIIAIVVVFYYIRRKKSRLV